MKSKHLEDINKSYYEHGVCALKYSCKLQAASLALIIHAFFPNIFVHYASNTLKSISEEMKK